MKYGVIPRIAILYTLGSASLIWFSIALALSSSGAAHGAEGLSRVLIALGSVALAASLFGVAIRLARVAEESRARRLVPVRVQARVRH